MEEKFEKNILKKKLFEKKDKLLLAISGGVDSVVLAHLLNKLNYKFDLVHCNFNLRAKESKLDEQFCLKTAKQLKVKIFIKQFKLEEYCKKHKISIQMAARDLRYEWFSELLKIQSYSYLLTAHHSDDLVETIFINLLRGTGIKGLKGISEKKDDIIRPLLIFNKQEIELFAKKQKINFRLDKSNLNTKYERNLLRLEIIPKLKKRHPQLEQTFLKNTEHFIQEASIVEDYLKHKYKKLVTTNSNSLKINKHLLNEETHKETIINFILKPFNFNETQEKNLINSISKKFNTGKGFLSQTHQLIIDRDYLIIKPIHKEIQNTLYINSINELKHIPDIAFSKTKKINKPKKNELYISEKDLIFPIQVRTKKIGDQFIPFGMNVFKLISKIYKDEKLNAFEKTNTKLLINGNNDIIWIIGLRSDQRYKIDKQTDLIKLTFSAK